MTDPEGLTRLVRDVTDDLHGIVARLRRDRLTTPDPRVLAILVEMEHRIEQAVTDAGDKLRRLDRLS